jgi:hypothetical protein
MLVLQTYLRAAQVAANDTHLPYCHCRQVVWMLLQAYLDDFEKFCSKLGGATAEVMGDLLAFEVLHPALCACCRLDGASQQQQRQHV